METNVLMQILELAVGIAALIIIHEFGHFAAARLFKIPVEEFGLGFPPRVATLFTAGGTKFTLNLLPIGGFVRPKGENDPSIPDGLAAANPWKRLGVLVAGPLMNLLVGVLLYAMIINRIGTPIPDQVQVVEVAPNSPAAQAGLLPDDMILWVNETKIDGTESIQSAIYSNLGKEIEITFSRDGQSNTVTLIPRANPPEGEGAIGIVMSHPTQPVSVIAALPAGVSAVYQHGETLLTFPVKIIRGEMDPSEGRLLGFKGMFDVYQAVQETEVQQSIPAGVNVLGFFATLTISFGVLNLLPIPALDGGRIMFTLPEIILGRRVPPKYENAIHLVSLALLLMLLLFVNLQDFINPISLPR
ncbi:MAG: site-2 protease family protein [Chloroflexota bacterium]|nr:MAG: site-2 protease family protein [Chloroflexota bacterium]